MGGALSSLPGRIFSILAFAATLVLWRWIAHFTRPLWFSPAVALLAPALIFPVVWWGRTSLDHDPTAGHAAGVTRVVHVLTMIVIGSALISAVVAGHRLPWGWFPFPSILAGILTTITAVMVLLTVLNLAARGLGAPWAISLSQRLATDWLYARTRNPMVLALTVFLFCLGLQLRSSLFLLWLAAVFVPAMVVFLHFYEERELEIRFGESYRQYRSVTPMFFPRLR
ncbi:MAG TPA: isoprenylcysteine carboxylmethyltransferase family protein [Verrucomicrobiae bacterium]|nr:isoprenylcysteine carboxylmethyltransferase family protein [Verrucomicrobiae bacterium]